MIVRRKDGTIITEQQAAAAIRTMPAPPDSPPPTPRPPRVTWDELNRWAQTFVGTARDATLHLGDLSPRISADGCSCESHWLAYLYEHPIERADNGYLWRWVQEARAAVARRVGKPVFTVEQAAAAQGINPDTGKPDITALAAKSM